MTKNLLIVLALTGMACFFGCSKGDEPVKESVAAIEADAKASAAQGAPRPEVPPAAQDQMSKALNDPNTPPEVKAKIKAQMGGGGQ